MAAISRSASRRPAACAPPSGCRCSRPGPPAGLESAAPSCHLRSNKLAAGESRPSEAHPSEAHAFQADVAKLLHLMVHSVYSDKSVFLRELIANAADACERLRYEALAEPKLLGDDPKPRITLAVDADKRTLAVEDNGIGMSRDEMVEALGTIARSGTKAFIDRLAAGAGAGDSDSSTEDNALIGRFGVGFYSAFRVADRVDVISRRAATAAIWLWSSDGKGTFSIPELPAD